jgi:hypothetical protein
MALVPKPNVGDTFKFVGNGGQFFTITRVTRGNFSIRCRDWNKDVTYDWIDWAYWWEQDDVRAASDKKKRESSGHPLTKIFR